MPFPRIAIAATIGWLTMAAAGAATAQSTAETVDGNDNRRPAGILADGALTVRIYAARGDWRPERDEGPALNVTAFGEEGGPLVTPGPLLRVPEGTDVIVHVRNTLAERLTIHGFVTRPAAEDAIFTVEPGQTREIRFAAGASRHVSLLGDHRRLRAEQTPRRREPARRRVHRRSTWIRSDRSRFRHDGVGRQRVARGRGRGRTDSSGVRYQRSVVAAHRTARRAGRPAGELAHREPHASQSPDAPARVLLFRAQHRHRLAANDVCPRRVPDRCHGTRAGRPDRAVVVDSGARRQLAAPLSHDRARDTGASLLVARRSGPRTCDTRRARCHDRHGRSCHGHSRLRSQPGGGHTRAWRRHDSSRSRCTDARGTGDPRTRTASRSRPERMRQGRRTFLSQGRFWS